MKEILRALGPVKRRIRRNRLLSGAAAGLAAGLGAAVLLRIVSFFVPLQDRLVLCGALAVGVALMAAAGNALRPVADRTAAEAADACGLKERTVTALETGDAPIHALQRRDALKALNALDPKQIRLKGLRRPLLAALCGAVLLGGLLLIPGRSDREADARKVLAKTLKEGMESIQRAAEQDEREMADPQRSELRKLTADLDRQLKDSRDEADALVAMDRAQQRLEQLRQKTAGDAVDAAAEADGTAKAGENADGQDGSDASASSAQQGTGQTGQNAGKAGDAGQLKTAQALSALQSTVNPALSRASQAGQQMTGQGSGEGQNGEGQSGLSGAGNSGGTQTGSGAGTGSTNEDQGASPGRKSSGPVKGDRDPEYKEEKYETIYDPEHISKETRDEMTNQERRGDDGSQQLQTGPGKGNLSGDVPWTSAVGEYAETEARAAEQENLTTRERQWVTDYYALLTEQQ